MTRKERVEIPAYRNRFNNELDKINLIINIRYLLFMRGDEKTAAAVVMIS